MSDHPEANRQHSDASPPPSELRDEVIERLYDVAIDPTRYEDLLDRWESLIRPYRQGANGTLLDDTIGREFAAHFNRADRVLEQTEICATQEAEQTPLKRVHKSAAFLVGQDQTILEVNAAARHALGLKKGARLAALPLDEDDRSALMARIGALLRANSDSTVIERARAAKSDRLIIFQLTSLHPREGTRIVLVVTSEVLWPEGFGELLKSAFDLTPAESDVLRGLSECQTLKEIAAARGRSVETVRAQLRAIMSKTETRSQTELVRLTLSMMDISAYTDDAATTAPTVSGGSNQLKARAFQHLTLADGRQMDYLVLGDQQGRPCLFFPQDYGLTRWPASAEAEAEARHIKVVVPVRAGYGASSPLPRKANPAELAARDAAQLMDHLSIPYCPVISLASDDIFAVHLHHLFPERVSAFLACAGTLPLSRSEQYERMGKWHRFINASARYTPHLLPFMVKAGMMMTRRLGNRKFLHAVYGNSPADVATIEDTEAFEAIEAGSTVCMSPDFTAHVAFAREVIAHETIDWAPMIREMRGAIPVHYFNGLQDPQMPAKTLEEFTHDYPWVEFHIFEDAGQLLFFRKWRDVLPVLEQYL